MFEVVQIVTPTGKTDDVLKITNTSSSEMSYTFGDILEIDNDYTFSCWMKSDVNTNTEVYISTKFDTFDLTSDWIRVIFTATSNIITSKEVRFTIPVGATIYAYEGQLEIGNKATDFSTNPEDVKDSITDVNDKVVVLQTNFTVQQGQIDALIKETTIDGESLKDKFTQMEATVDGIQTSVGNIQTDVDGMESRLAEVKITADGVSSTVSASKDKWDKASTDATAAKTIAEQTADRFSWIVKSGTSETNFELTDRTAQLVANNINLKGLVTFEGLNSTTQDLINKGASAFDEIQNLDISGKNLARQTSIPITQLEIWDSDVGQVVGSYRVVFPLDAVANDIYSVGFDYTSSGITSISGQTAKIELVSNYDGGTETVVYTIPINQTGEATFTFNVTQAQLNAEYITMSVRCTDISAGTLTIKLFRVFEGNELYEWEAAPEDALEIVDRWASDAVQGSTLINGGYIQTHTIKTEHLDVDEILAEDGTFLGVIEAREINADRITSGHIKSDILDVYGLNVLQKDTDVVTFNIDNNGEVTVRGSVESYDYVSGKTGWSIRSSGDAEFNDITVRGDLIGNYGGMMSLGGTGRNLLKDSGTSITSGEYLVKSYELTVKPTVGKTYSISLKGELGEGKTGWGIYNSGGDVQLCSLISDNASGDGLWQISFEWQNTSGSITADDTTLKVYAMPMSVTDVESTIDWIKLEEGETSTPWSAAPEDEIKQVVFWAGGSYDQRDYAPFRVYSDGSVNATEGTYSGMWVGDIRVGNISITDPSSVSGGDAIFTIKDGGNGINRVQLTDMDSSTFAQNINITDDFYNNTIELHQDGLINTKGSVRAESDNSFSILDDEGVVINGNRITGDDESLSLVSNTVYVGSPTTNGNLDVFGDISTNNLLYVGKEINFGNIIYCKITQRGIDFSFNDVVTVTFNSTGGSQVQNQFVRIGGYVIKPVDPVRANYKFYAWYKDVDLKTEWNFNTDVVSENTTLYAKWLALPKAPQVSVQNYTTQTYHDGDFDYEQGLEAKTGITISAGIVGGGSLSYRWNLYHYYYDINGNVQTEAIDTTGVRLSFSKDKINQYIRTMSASALDYSTIHGTVAVTNALNGFTALTTVEVGYRL